MAMAETLIQIDELLGCMWEQFAIVPTHMFISPAGHTAIIRINLRMKYGKPGPVHRTTNMRRMRKLKYRRKP
jgi:hypothetical protein